MNNFEDEFWIDEDQEGGNPIVYGVNTSTWYETKQEAEMVKLQIIKALRLKEEIEKKLDWYSTWRGHDNENGRIYKFIEEMLGVKI